MDVLQKQELVRSFIRRHTFRGCDWDDESGEFYPGLYTLENGHTPYGVKHRVEKVLYKIPGWSWWDLRKGGEGCFREICAELGYAVKKDGTLKYPSGTPVSPRLEAIRRATPFQKWLASRAGEASPVGDLAQDWVTGYGFKQSHLYWSDPSASFLKMYKGLKYTAAAPALIEAFALWSAQAGETAECTEHILYRHYAADNTLLYIGITNNPPARLTGHRDGSPWWKAVAWSRYEPFGSREELKKAERESVRRELPKWNVHYSTRKLKI